jgi:small-conductance mechanosensitive channel
MRRVSLDRFYVGVLALLLWVAVPAWAATVTPVSRLAVAEQQVLDENAGLEELSERLDQIRQGVTSNANDDLLAQLRQSALQVQRQADVLVTARTADVQRLDDQLNVLGPPMPEEAEPDPPAQATER